MDEQQDVAVETPREWVTGKRLALVGDFLVTRTYSTPEKPKPSMAYLVTKVTKSRVTTIEINTYNGELFTYGSSTVEWNAPVGPVDPPRVRELMYARVGDRLAKVAYVLDDPFPEWWAEQVAKKAQAAELYRQVTEQRAAEQLKFNAELLDCPWQELLDSSTVIPGTPEIRVCQVVVKPWLSSQETLAQLVYTVEEQPHWKTDYGVVREVMANLAAEEGVAVTDLAEPVVEERLGRNSRVYVKGYKVSAVVYTVGEYGVRTSSTDRTEATLGLALAGVMRSMDVLRVESLQVSATVDRSDEVIGHTPGGLPIYND